jgi:rhodanese-related sulfurtransferase
MNGQPEWTWLRAINQSPTAIAQVCYCTIGMRSGQFAKELCERGFNASNLEHSILGWVSV